jgi:hypothetical protein
MASHSPTLQTAVDDLYRLTVTEGKATSTKRLSVLADLCVSELWRRGLPGAEAEVTIPAGGRDKDWDVAWKWAGKYRLVLSLKSILKNLAGTVPNRIDDAMGETTSIQLYSPEVVTGYVMLFNTADDRYSKKHGHTWAEHLTEKLSALSGRRAPYWSPGTFEAFCVVQVNFSDGPLIVGGEPAFSTMMDRLVQETNTRNPGISEST